MANNDHSVISPLSRAHESISCFQTLSQEERIILFSLCFSEQICNNNSKQRGSGIAQWLESQTPDQKVVGSSPCRSGGRIFFSSTFCADSYFGIRSTPVLPQ